MEFATKPYDISHPTHLRHVATLPWKPPIRRSELSICSWISEECEYESYYETCNPV